MGAAFAAGGAAGVIGDWKNFANSPDDAPGCVGGAGEAG